MSKNKTFTVQSRLDLWVGTEIKATDLEDAVAQSRKLEVQDFVTIPGDYCDGSLRITGVYES